MGKRTEPFAQQDTLKGLALSLHEHHRKRFKRRRIAAIGCLVLGIGLLVSPKPEEPPLWLTTLFVSAVLGFTVSLGWLCRGLTEDVGYGASVRAPIFRKFLALLSFGDTAEVIPVALDTWRSLSQSQRDVLVGHLAPLLARLESEQAIRLTLEQRRALEEVVRYYSQTDVAILGLLILASAQHYGEKLLPSVYAWSVKADRRGVAAREYLLSLKSGHG